MEDALRLIPGMDDSIVSHALRATWPASLLSQLLVGNKDVAQIRLVGLRATQALTGTQVSAQRAPMRSAQSFWLTARLVDPPGEQRHLIGSTPSFRLPEWWGLRAGQFRAFESDLQGQALTEGEWQARVRLDPP